MTLIEQLFQNLNLRELIDGQRKPLSYIDNLSLAILSRGLLNLVFKGGGHVTYSDFIELIPKTEGLLDGNSPKVSISQIIMAGFNWGDAQSVNWCDLHGIWNYCIQHHAFQIRPNKSLFFEFDKIITI